MENYEESYYDPDKGRRIGNVLLICTTALLILGMLSLWITGYYSQSLFHFEGQTYKLQDTDNGENIYKSANGSERIRIFQEDGPRRMQYGDELFTIEELPKTGAWSMFRITYPNGTVYTVETLENQLLAKDANGEWLTVGVYADGVRKLKPGEPHPHPSSIVTAAYEQYHERQGLPILLVPALFCLALGWLLLRSERFVLLQFKLSYGLWVEDPEPTDFYLFMAKVGGWALIAAAVAVTLMSL